MILNVCVYWHLDEPVTQWKNTERVLRNQRCPTPDAGHFGHHRELGDIGPVLVQLLIIRS